MMLNKINGKYDFDTNLNRITKIYKYLCNGGKLSYKDKTVAMSENDDIGFLSTDKFNNYIDKLFGCELVTIKLLFDISNNLPEDEWMSIIAYIVLTKHNNRKVNEVTLK